MKAMLEVCTPTSISYSGTSASITADGGVEFTGVTSLSLNGVFTGDYDNYMIVRRGTTSSNDFNAYRLRASGTDNATTNAYVSQRITAGDTSISPFRFTLTFGMLGYASQGVFGHSYYLFGPNLAQPTAARSITGHDLSGAYIYDVASTHNQSTAYDGITFLFYSGGSFASSGLVTVFGFTQ